MKIWPVFDLNHCLNYGFQLESKLARRVEEAIFVWTKTLTCTRDELDEEKEINVSPNIQKIRLEIRISSPAISVFPSLEKGRQMLLTQFFLWHGVVTSQPRVTNKRFQVYWVFGGCTQ